MSETTQLFLNVIAGFIVGAGVGTYGFSRGWPLWRMVLLTLPLCAITTTLIAVLANHLNRGA